VLVKEADEFFGVLDRDMVDAVFAPHWVMAVKVSCHDNCCWLVCGFYRLLNTGLDLSQHCLD
jgi:hypothetical protein